MPKRYIIPVNNINLGGIADSKYQGRKYSVSKLVGFDIHSKPGVLTVNQRFTKEFGDGTDQAGKKFYKMLKCSDGKIYLFDWYGTIWSRNSSGVYMREVNAALVFMVDAIEFNGHIYYSYSGKLGRWQIGTSWSSRNDLWQTFSSSYLWQPLAAVNGVLYIGNGKNIHQVDKNHVFTANALDLPTGYAVTALQQFDTDLLIGASNTYTQLSEVFFWNTWSVSWSASDRINETLLNSFIAIDDYILVNVGSAGNLYLINGSKLEFFKKLPGDYTKDDDIGINRNAVGIFKGLPVFGVGRNYITFTNATLTNATLPGLYSFGSRGPEYPRVLNLESPISTGLFDKIEITSVLVDNTDVYIAWYNHANSTNGVDKLDYTAKIPRAYFETRILRIDSHELNKFIEYIVNYVSYPLGAQIKIYYKQNYEATWHLFAEILNDAKRMRIYSQLDLEAAVLELKVEVIPSGNTAPEITDLQIITV